MASLNKAMIIGHLGQSPEVKFTPGGQAVCALSVATNEEWTDKQGQKQSKTEWHRVNVWGKMAEACGKYLQKGKQVYVEGKIGTREWTDKDGVKRYTTEITAQTVNFLGAPTGGGDRPPLPTEPTGAAAAGAQAQAGTQAPPATEEDIPF